MFMMTGITTCCVKPDDATYLVESNCVRQYVNVLSSTFLAPTIEHIVYDAKHQICTKTTQIYSRITTTAYHFSKAMSYVASSVVCCSVPRCHFQPINDTLQIFYARKSSFSASLPTHCSHSSSQPYSSVIHTPNFSFSASLSTHH